MERAKHLRIPSAILTADWHLRKDTPLCWTGDFQTEQWNTLDFLKNLQRKYNCPIIVAGDLFEKWHNTNDFLTIIIQHLPDQLYVIYGQHDLPNHNLALAYKSSIDTLAEARLLRILEGCYYGQTPPTEPFNDLLAFENRKFLVWHYLTYNILPPFPGATGGNAVSILRKYSKFDLIVTGDNHESFTVTLDNRLLVNPGSLTRQTADQIDFQPRIALWYADTNTIEWIDIPIQQGVITREHIDKVKERDERIDAFISKLDSEWKAGFSFEQNMEQYLQINNVDETIKQIVWKAME